MGIVGRTGSDIFVSDSNSLVASLLLVQRPERESLLVDLNSQRGERIR
jgi:hypothetical protein